VEDKQMALAIKQLAIWQFAKKEQNLTLINTDAADREKSIQKTAFARKRLSVSR
jgi:hypothetical protein